VAVLSANDDAERFELTLISHTSRVARRIALASATFNDGRRTACPVQLRARRGPAGPLAARAVVRRPQRDHGQPLRRRPRRPDVGVNGLMHLKASHSVCEAEQQQAERDRPGAEPPC
jgi:hypothetical protein